MVATVNSDPQVARFTSGQGGTLLTPQISMVIYNPVEQRSPTNAQVTVGGATPGATLTFQVDGTTVWTSYADAEGNLALTSIPINRQYGAGVHAITVVSSGNGVDSRNLQLLSAPYARPSSQGNDLAPVLVASSAGRFVFQDLLPGGLGSWVMPINPDAMTPPEFSRTVSDSHTTSPIQGQLHLTENFQTVKNWKLKGYCPNEAYDAKLRGYAALRRRLYVIDHRGRAWIVVIVNYALESRRRHPEGGAWNDWSGNWTMDLAILSSDWLTPA